MVLVFGKLRDDIGILQTKFRYREGHETRRVGLEAMPLDQHVEGGHGEGQTRLKIRPSPNPSPSSHGRRRVSIESTVSTSIRSCHSPPLTQCEIAWDRPRQHGSPYHSGQSSVPQPAESATETCYRRHGPWHMPTPRSTPIDCAADRVCPRQSSDDWRALLPGRSAGGCGLRAWDGWSSMP